MIKEDILLSSSLDTTLKLWHLKTLECEETFVMNKSEINYMIKLKDNRIVTSVSENNIDIWKLETINY